MIIYDDGSYSNKVNMFKDAAQKLKHNVKDILVFEDSFRNSNAYKAGIEKIVVICPQEKESEYRDLPGVIVTIQDFSDFNKLISRIGYKKSQSFCFLNNYMYIYYLKS